MRATTAAGWLLLVIGAIHAVQGLVVLLGGDTFDVSRAAAFDVGTTWGWIHLVVGAAAVAAGAGLLRRAGWARAAAAVVATLSLFGNLLWFMAFPLGVSVAVALDIFVMWAAFADLRRPYR